MHTTCPTHLILVNLIILTILGEEYRLWSSSCKPFSTECSEIRMSIDGNVHVFWISTRVNWKL